MLKRPYQSFVKRLCAGLLAGALAAGVIPLSLAADTPSAYQAQGRIDYIEQQNNIVVIDDSQFNLAANVQVRSAGGKGDKHSLRKGMNVGFNYTQAGRDRTINQIWVLPGN